MAPPPPISSTAAINDTITILADLGNDNAALTQTITIPRAGRIIDIVVWNPLGSTTTIDVKLNGLNVATQFTGTALSGELLRAVQLIYGRVDVVAGDTLEIIRGAAGSSDCFSVYITFFAPGAPLTATYV